MLPADRRKRILELLAEQETVRVAELSQRFSVSEMTIHRDLSRLADRGQLRKVRGGAVLPGGSRLPTPERTCCICHTARRSRIPMLLHLADGTPRHACCPHCGLLALGERGLPVVSALATDFLYQRTVSARTASYLITPQIQLCCTPTVLAFERLEDAGRFQAGFGGQVLDLEAAKSYLAREMRLRGE